MARTSFMTKAVKSLVLPKILLNFATIRKLISPAKNEKHERIEHPLSRPSISPSVHLARSRRSVGATPLDVGTQGVFGPEVSENTFHGRVPLSFEHEGICMGCMRGTCSTVHRHVLRTGGRSLCHTAMVGPVHGILPPSAGPYRTSHCGERIRTRSRHLTSPVTLCRLWVMEHMARHERMGTHHLGNDRSDIHVGESMVRPLVRKENQLRQKARFRNPIKTFIPWKV